MTLRLPATLLVLVSALALGACEGEAPGRLDSPTPSPLLYTISAPDGATEGWLFGTIHTLPDGVEWRTPALEQAIDEADLLVVEIAALDDAADIAHTFAALASSPGQPEIGARVPASQRQELLALVERSGHDPADFAETETWAAALMLAQNSDNGSASNGADRALLRDFANREIRELEGTARQLGIFDRLPERDQRDLLTGVIAEAKERKSDPERLRRAWLAGDEATLIDATTSGILADRELRAALLTNRNRDWAGQLERMLRQPEQPMVAVGAAHLVGPEGLAELLRQAGYRVARVQ
ncbi:MAG: TraB/GumN family protein [Erythrobacter sp.]